MRTTKEIEVGQLGGHPLNREVITVGAEWEEFEASVRLHGVLEALTVRPFGDGFQVLAGHRRLAAARRCGLAVVPCEVKVLSDDEALWFLVNSNLQRLNLSLTEEAKIVSALVDQLKVTWEEVARKLSREEIWVRTRQLVFEFPDEVVRALDAREECGRLSEGAFREIIRAPRELWDAAVQCVLFPPGSDEPLSEQRAREEIQFALIPEWVERKKWEDGAEKLRKAMQKDLRKLCDDPVAAELTVVIGQWDGGGAAVIDAVDAASEVPVEYLREGWATGKAWVAFAEKIGLPVVILRVDEPGGKPRAVVSRRAIMDDAAAREEHGMEWPLRGRPVKKDARVAAAVAALEGEGEAFYEEAEPVSEVATPGDADGVKIEQRMEHFAMIDMGAVTRLKAWAIATDSDPVKSPEWVPGWAKDMAMMGYWEEIDQVCNWVASLKGGGK
jgi:ParB/RepB/Spo0J family partition protein